MSETNNRLRYGELALAAYVRLDTQLIPPSSLRAVGLSSPHASRFANEWRLIDQFEHTTEPYWSYDPETNVPSGPYAESNGCSATVFENVLTHERVLAIRGTNDVHDIATDVISVAALGSTRSQGQYQSLRTKVQEWVASGVLPARFAVTGHSLGGFLATGLALEFPQYVDHAYLYNSPGLGGLTNRPVLDSSGSRRHRIRPGSTRSDSDSHSSASVRTAWPENGCGCVLLSHPATTLTDPRSPNVLGLSDDCGQAYRFR